MGLRSQCGGRNTNAATNAAAVPNIVNAQIAASGWRNAAFTIEIAIAAITTVMVINVTISSTNITTISLLRWPYCSP